jgi:C-terminal processing protease CtpA/Prc
MIDNKVPALIIDVRNNGGGSGGIALDFAGYFFSEEINLYRESYYNERLQKFEYSDYPAQIKPAPVQYDGPIALLVGPDCVSACEGFSYAMQYGGRSTVVGHYPTAGGFGEVGRGQYKLPDDIQLQFPTGRPETPDGKVLIEGVGVQPDITVPVTRESALGQQDTVLEAAVQALQKQIGK